MPLVFQLILRIHASNPGKRFFLASFYLELVFGKSTATACSYPGKSHQSNIFTSHFVVYCTFSLAKTQIVLNCLFGLIPNTHVS